MSRIQRNPNRYEGVRPERCGVRPAERRAANMASSASMRFGRWGTWRACGYDLPLNFKDRKCRAGFGHFGLVAAPERPQRILPPILARLCVKRLASIQNLTAQTCPA